MHEEKYQHLISPQGLAEILWQELSDLVHYDEEQFNEDLDHRITDETPFNLHDVARTYYETPYLFWYAVYTTLIVKFPAIARDVVERFTDILLTQMTDRVHPDVFRVYANRFHAGMPLPTTSTEPMKSDVILSAAGYAAYRIFGKRKGDPDLVVYMTLPAIRIAYMFRILREILEEVPVI